MDTGGQQGLQHFHVVGLAQEVVDMLGHHVPHIRHLEQLLDRGGAQCLQGQEMVGQVQRGRLPHFADTEGKQEAR